MTAYTLLSENEDRKNGWPARNSAWATAFEAFCRWAFKSYCPLKCFGQESLPAPPYLICANHSSHADSAALMVAAKLPFNEIGLIAAKDYFFDKPEFFFVKHLLNLVPIARGKGSKALKDSIERSRIFLASGGKALIIYPEGTRSLGNNIAKFKEGAAILAHELNLPIVPAFISGSRNVLPKGSYMLRPKPLSVSFGPSLKVCDFIEADASEERRAIFNAYREATAELERRVLALQKKNGHVV